MQDSSIPKTINHKNILKIILPSIFTFVFIAIYQMVDGFFIEKFVGDVAIGAVNLYYPILALIVAVGIMIGTGANAVMVKKIGEGKVEEASKTFSNTILFTILISIIFTVISLVFSEAIMKLCGATAGNIDFLRPYYNIMCLFSISIILQSTLGILIIGEGKTVTAAVVIIVGGVLNCLLDYILMNNFNMGITGAAIATVIGYSSSIIFAIFYYLIKKKSAYKFKITKINFKEIGSICFNGSSDMVTNLAGGVTAVFMNHLAFKFYGEIGVSALSVVLYFQFLIIAVFMGLTSAVEPLFSYYYGSGDKEMRVKTFKLSIFYTLIFSILLGVLFLIFNSAVVGLFFEQGTQIYDITKTGLLISLFACLFIGFNTFISGLFTAFSNGLVSGLLSFIRTFLILTICLFVLSSIFNEKGLWAAWPVAEFISFIISLIVLFKFKNKYGYMKERKEL